jgi:hypothetical protein
MPRIVGEWENLNLLEIESIAVVLNELADGGVDPVGDKGRSFATPAFIGGDGPPLPDFVGEAFGPFVPIEESAASDLGSSSASFA